MHVHVPIYVYTIQLFPTSYHPSIPIYRYCMFVRVRQSNYRDLLYRMHVLYSAVYHCIIYVTMHIITLISSGKLCQVVIDLL